MLCHFGMDNIGFKYGIHIRMLIINILYNYCGNLIN
jgi:hypothetical protein